MPIKTLSSPITQYWNFATLTCVDRQSIEGNCDSQSNSLSGYTSLGTSSLSYSSQCLTYLGLRCQNIPRTVNFGISSATGTNFIYLHSIKKYNVKLF